MQHKRSGSPNTGLSEALTLFDFARFPKYDLIKYIIGHQITDVTEKVYTQRDVSWLHEEIEKNTMKK